MQETGKRKAPSSPRILELQKKKKKIFRVKIIFFSFLFVAFLVGLSFLSRWKEINISTIQIYGNRIVDTSTIEKVVNEELDGHYFWVLPKRNIFLFPKNKIIQRLENEYKRLENVELNLTESKVLEVSLVEHKALYTWCGSDLNFYTEIVSSNDELEKKCFFMNESGYIFDKAPYFSGNVYLKFFGSLDRKLESPLGQNYAPVLFNQIVKFLDEIKQLGLEPESLFVKEDGDIDLYLKSSSFSADLHKIVFNTKSDFDKISENLRASITTEPLKSELEKRYEDLLYIDLRFGNKIYYKFK